MKKDLPVGVYQKKGRTTFYAMFQRGINKRLYLGSFNTVKEAENAYNTVKDRIDLGELDFEDSCLRAGERTGA